MERAVKQQQDRTFIILNFFYISISYSSRGCQFKASTDWTGPVTARMVNDIRTQSRKI